MKVVRPGDGAYAVVSLASNVVVIMSQAMGMVDVSTLAGPKL